MMKKISTWSFCLYLFICFCSCGEVQQKETDREIAKASLSECDNPDADINCCFANMPESISNIMTIASANEPGEALIISGTIFKADGKTPYQDVLMYAYHTDNTGVYAKTGKETGIQKWHGRLHGWCKTDSKGHYEIHTIRPARYPNSEGPAHIHAAIKTEKGKAFYISDFVLKDDPFVNEKYFSMLNNPIGGDGVVDVKKSGENVWIGKRDIVLDLK